MLPEKLKEGLLELAKIQLQIDNNGGVDNNGVLFDEHYNRSVELLESFGLPPSAQYIDLLFVKKPPTEADLDFMLTILVTAAEDYLSSPVKTEVQILEEAINSKADHQQILPELGITLHIYPQFVYEYILLEKRDAPANVLEALRLADTPRNLTLLGIVALAKTLGEDEQKMMEELYGIGIKYLDQYLIAYRVEDEKAKHHFSQLDEFWNDLTGGSEFKTLEDKFDTLAGYLMNHLYLSVGKQSFRIIELEIYYHDPINHPDPYAHCAPEQLTAGRWYYNGMGVDITFGDMEKKIYGGILVRGVRTIDDKPRYISGTINVLREIFNNLGDITKGGYGFCIKEALDDFEEAFTPVKSTRIGLTRKKEDAGNCIDKKYRYLAEVNLPHKFKDKEKVVKELLIAGVITKDKANEIMGYKISI